MLKAVHMKKLNAIRVSIDCLNLQTTNEKQTLSAFFLSCYFLYFLYSFFFFFRLLPKTDL